MKALKLIIAREYVSRVKTKAFILTTLLTPLLMAAVIFLPTIIMTMKNTDIKTVYVIDKTEMYAPLLKSTNDLTFEVLTNEEQEHKTGEGYALLKIDADLSKMPNAVTFFSEMQKPPVEVTGYVSSVLTEEVKNQKLKEYTSQKEIDSEIVVGLQEIVNSQKKIEINTFRLDATGETKDTVGDLASKIGMVFTFAMFMFVMMYGSQVTQSVVEEKSNRIIEVIISSVKPFDLMMGKIIGVALVGFTQVFAWIVLAVVAAAIILPSLGGVNMSVEEMTQAVEVAKQGGIMTGDIQSQLAAILTINWYQVVICFVLYFAGGYLLFAALFAMFGSAANDAQEAQQFVTPLTIILMVAFYVGFAAAKNPEGPAAIWGSIIPFTSPVVMMVRTPFEIPFWHILVSLILLYGTAILMIFLAAKIYRTGILMHGKKVSFMEIFKWLSYK